MQNKKAAVLILSSQGLMVRIRGSFNHTAFTGCPEGGPDAGVAFGCILTTSTPGLSSNAGSRMSVFFGYSAGYTQDIR